MPSLAEIQTAIERKRASWEAADTPIFQMPLAEASGLFGLEVGQETNAALLTASSRALNFQANALPPKIDWRDFERVNWVTPVKSQSTCGSCVSFAVIAAMEVSARRAKSDASLAIDLSEADLFFCAGRKCAGGWEVPLALERAKSQGVGAEAAFPYSPKDQPCRPTKPIMKVTHWSALMSRDQRKTALAEDGPIVGCMKVFEDFRAYKAGIYEHVTGAQIGLHAVCIVGFDDDQGCWIVKNSWSDRFGEDGYFRIRYGECCVDDVFPSYQLNVEMIPEGTV